MNLYEYEIENMIDKAIVLDGPWNDITNRDRKPTKIVSFSTEDIDDNLSHICGTLKVYDTAVYEIRYEDSYHENCTAAFYINELIYLFQVGRLRLADDT